jgi:hypothetical protein
MEGSLPAGEHGKKKGRHGTTFTGFHAGLFTPGNLNDAPCSPASLFVLSPLLVANGGEGSQPRVMLHIRFISTPQFSHTTILILLA